MIEYFTSTQHTFSVKRNHEAVITPASVDISVHVADFDFSATSRREFGFDNGFHFSSFAPALLDGR